MQVFDRLQKLGIATSYSRSMELLKQIEKHYVDELRSAIGNDNTFRFVGDNINWKTRANDQRFDRAGKMNNAFAAIAIVQNCKFDECSNEQPSVSNITSDFLLPNESDLRAVQNLFAIIVTKVIVDHFPILSYLDVFDTSTFGCHNAKLTSKNKVINLPIMFKNEQHIADVVDIMDEFEKILVDVYGDKLNPSVQIHIGGDQLTRERFSSAKRIRATAKTDLTRYQHLQPISFEFFHLEMKYLEYFYKTLYNKSSAMDVGTMFSMKLRVNRTNVNDDVHSNFDANKDFAISIIDVHILEAALTFFGMADGTSNPTLHVPPRFENFEEQKQWVHRTLQEFISTYILCSTDIGSRPPSPSTAKKGNYSFRMVGYCRESSKS